MSADGAITFFVPGVPATAGSKRSFRHAVTGKIIVLDDCERYPAWRDRVASFALWKVGTGGALAGPLILEVQFVLPRPRSHFGTGRNADRLLPSAPRYHTIRPDTTKLLRAIEDSIKHICWRDDSQVVKQIAEKGYGTQPGARVAVRRLGDGDGEGDGDA